MKVRVVPTAEEIAQERTRENLERVIRAKEQKKRAKLDMLLAMKNMANAAENEGDVDDLSIDNSGDAEENVDAPS
ncbi:Hypothetical protein NTJ_08735 [Nesidiocoris tenuis]|uniref:Stathmin n=1 Tax=Nesidiocoris tenuis TaxID=355587 RepID=A0ABN7AYI8_9HEMI|nr:Hypothetical protein NTJ_08735 [Nesidiocoris tenuis]